MKNAHEEDSDSDESSQVEDAGVSAPATPPNGNKRNNKNNGGKDFNKIKNNREANKLAQKFGYKNAESFKREFVFNDGVHFNIALNKSTGEIILVSIYNSKIVINTGFFYR